MTPSSAEKPSDLDSWDGTTKGGGIPTDRLYQLFQAPVPESDYDRKQRMLFQVNTACMACSMCELGRQGATKDGKLYLDPHVHSNMNPTRFVVVGQNPGWTELEKREPFVGPAGANFDREIVKYGLSRKDFYIINTVRCFSAGNVRPTEEQAQRCSPFLAIDLCLVRPLLVVALGAVAFERLCPQARFSDRLRKLTWSKAYEVPVFAVYHPSPRNLVDEGRMADFKEQMKVMCLLVRKLQEQHHLSPLASNKEPCAADCS